MSNNNNWIKLGITSLFLSFSSISIAEQQPELYAQNQFGSSHEYSHKMGTSSRYNNTNGQITKEQDYKSTTTIKDKRKSVFTNQEEKPFVPHPDYYNYQYLSPTTNSLSH